jgi:3-hydroxyisobutyrate dehydrogenase-like beta-hydroxyacid dehydrogenase
MDPMTIGFLHPGEMGVSLAATALRGGHRALWASEGRSPATRDRAADNGLTDAGSVGALCARSDLLVSICPPHAAAAVAAAVADAGFRGTFVDANAIAPERVVGIGRRLAGAGIEVVDGGVIGGPAWTPGTRLVLSGGRAAEVAAAFAAGPLATEVLGPELGTASALKMAYASVTKGTTALLVAALAAAEGHGVRAALARQWDLDEPGAGDARGERARRVTRKAWRFAGEMEEIAATFEAAGVPGGFHAAAAELYRRLAGLGGAAELPALTQVLAAAAGGGAAASGGDPLSAGGPPSAGGQPEDQR